MYCDKIADIINLFVCLYDRDIAGHIQCIVYRKIWITSIYFHAKTVCCIGNQYTDGSQTDDSKFFTGNLGSCKCFFCFFCCFGNPLVVFVFLSPLNTAYDITGSKKHCCDHKFFYAVCIGSRCIKYNDSFFCTFVQRNVIYTGSGSRYRHQIIGQFHLMHRSTSNQNRLCLCGIIYHLIIVIQ